MAPWTDRKGQKRWGWSSRSSWTSICGAASTKLPAEVSYRKNRRQKLEVKSIRRCSFWLIFCFNFFFQAKFLFSCEKPITVIIKVCCIVFSLSNNLEYLLFFLYLNSENKTIFKYNEEELKIWITYCFSWMLEMLCLLK